MTDETENLMPEPLRGLRAEMQESFVGLETRREGVRHALLASMGSIATDLKGPDARMTALEGARV